MRYAISATKAVGEDLSLNSGMTVILHAAQPLAIFPALPEASVTYGQGGTRSVLSQIQPILHPT